MESKRKIIIVSDDYADTERIKKQIETVSLSFEFLCIDLHDKIYDNLVSKEIDYIIFDINNFSNLLFNIIEKTKTLNELVKIFVIANNIGEENAVQLIKAGADDFILKENISKLPSKIKNLISKVSIDTKSIQTADKNNDVVVVDEENGSIVETTLNKNIPNLKKFDFNQYKILFDNTDFLNSVIDNIPGKILVKSVESDRIIYANNEFCKLFNFENNEVFSENLKNVFTPDSVERLNKYDDKLLKNGKSLNVLSLNLETKNGTKKNVELRVNRVDYNNVEYILYMMIDTTDLEVSITKNKNIEAQFFNLFHTAPIPIVITRLSDNTIVYTNKAFTEMIGYTEKEMVDVNGKYVEIWADISFRNKIVKRALEQRGNHHNVDAQLIRKDGNVIDTIVSVEKITIDDETLIIFMGIDITKRKNSENQLIETLNKQKELNLIRNHFVDLISHEYRTPLTSIMLSVDILKRYGNNWNKNDRDKHLQRIQDTILKMTQMMENVLILSNIESGQLGFNPDKFNLESFCSSVAKNAEINFHNKIKINYFYAPQVKDYTLDENLIGLIVNHLLSNALKYSYDKKDDIEFNIHSDEDNLFFEVKDNGIGIPQKDMSNIFKEFYRATNTANVSGYGLGLTIVKRAVEAYKGDIIISSEPHKGTQVKVIIPIINKKVDNV